MANAQNKHGAPGICTLSGEGFLRTYRASGDERILNLIQEISHNIPQYISRSDKPIPTRLSWGRERLTEQPEGWICERINLTDWGEPIGEQSAYSCWCEAAMMLAWNDLPGVYWDRETNTATALDHLRVEVLADGDRKFLRVINPTRFDAEVKILAETGTERAIPLPPNAGALYPRIKIPADDAYDWYQQRPTPT